jgi:hypothetical protein
VQLPQVGDGLCSSPSVSHLADRREQQTSQNRNDDDHYEQLNQGERTLCPGTGLTG